MMGTYGNSRQRSQDHVRELVLTYGYHANAYQVLNPGMRHWFSSHDPAVVGYVQRGRWWVAAGAPICDPANLRQVALEFQAAAQRHRCRVCYCFAEQPLVDCLQPLGHKVIALGAQPVWIPDHWPHLLQSHRSLRQQIRRAQNKGVYVQTFTPAQAMADMRFQDSLRLWLKHKPLAPMGFLAEPRALEAGYPDRLIWGAMQRQGDEGEKLLAFLLSSPVPRRSGFLVEQIIRHPAAPNGAVEMLIDACMRELHRRGSEYLTHGPVALSRYAPRAMASNPWWMRGLMQLTRRHLGRWYGFQTLESFRVRLRPNRWEPVYAIVHSCRFLPAAFYAMAGAFFRPHRVADAGDTD